eukprot:44559-Chlamydomonas_euryale.AAC.1
MAALDAIDTSRSYMWAKHRSDPTPGPPSGQTIPPFAPMGPEPTGAHGGQAAKGGGGCPSCPGAASWPDHPH